MTSVRAEAPPTAAAVPWEERPSGSSDVVWRSSRNPIVARSPIPRANSVFNSAVVPYGDGFAGVFRVDDTARVMNLHAGRSTDGISWEIDHEPIHIPFFGDYETCSQWSPTARIRPSAASFTRCAMSDRSASG